MLGEWWIHSRTTKTQEECRREAAWGSMLRTKGGQDERHAYGVLNQDPEIAAPCYESHLNSWDS